MSQLFPISVIAEGTSETESLSSVLHRLAYMHSVTVGEILRIIYQKYVGVIGLDNIRVDFRNERILQVFSRPNYAAKSLTSALEAITGLPNLARTTLLPLMPVLDRAQCAYSRDMKWCRACFRELSVAGEQGYYKLIWSLRTVTKCHIHGILLETRCGSCGSHQNTYSYRIDAKYCQKCHKALYSVGDANWPEFSFTNIDTDLIELIRSISSGYLDNLEQGAARKSLNKIFQWYWKRGKEQELYNLCGRDNLLSLMHGHRPITLNELRRFAYDIRTSLVDLVTGDGCTLSLELGDGQGNPEPEFKKPKKRIHRNHGKVHKAICDILKESGNPPSLKSVAELAGVSVGYITYRYPALAQKIVSKSRKYQEEVHERNQQMAMNYAVQYFYGEKYAHYPKSRKQALKTLIADTELPKGLLRACIKKVTASAKT